MIMNKLKRASCNLFLLRFCLHRSRHNTQTQNTTQCRAAAHDSRNAQHHTEKLSRKHCNSLTPEFCKSVAFSFKEHSCYMCAGMWYVLCTLSFLGTKFSCSDDRGPSKETLMGIRHRKLNASRSTKSKIVLLITPKLHNH